MVNLINNQPKFKKSISYLKHNLNMMKGCYCLVISLNDEKTIKIGKKLGKITFKKGHYVYVGSAMNSLKARITRHLSDEKKLHWHIDYLLKSAEITDVIYNESDRKIECELSQYLAAKTTELKDSDVQTAIVKVIFIILKIEKRLLRVLKTLTTQ